MNHSSSQTYGSILDGDFYSGYIVDFNIGFNKYGYNVLIGGENDINITEINLLIEEEKSKREKWAYGDLAVSQKLPFSIPDKFISKTKIKFPNNPNGLGSVMGVFIKEDQKVKSFDEYINKFLTRYKERKYVQAHKDLVPLLLAQQVLKIFPKTHIIKSNIKISANDKCVKCGKKVSENVKLYCLSKKEKFQGNIYCYEHQKLDIN